MNIVFFSTQNIVNVFFLRKHIHSPIFISMVILHTKQTCVVNLTFFIVSVHTNKQFNYFIATLSLQILHGHKNHILSQLQRCTQNNHNMKEMQMILKFKCIRFKIVETEWHLHTLATSNMYSCSVKEMHNMYTLVYLCLSKFDTFMMVATDVWKQCFKRHYLLQQNIINKIRLYNM